MLVLGLLRSNIALLPKSLAHNDEEDPLSINTRWALLSFPVRNCACPAADWQNP